MADLDSLDFNIDQGLAARRPHAPSKQFCVALKQLLNFHYDSL